MLSHLHVALRLLATDNFRDKKNNDAYMRTTVKVNCLIVHQKILR